MQNAKFKFKKLMTLAIKGGIMFEKAGWYGRGCGRGKEMEDIG